MRVIKTFCLTNRERIGYNYPMMNKATATAWLGMMTGLLGSALVASNIMLPGFGMFLTSNIAWTAHGIYTKNWPLLIMQAGFTATSLLGIYNNAG